MGIITVLIKKSLMYEMFPEDYWGSGLGFYNMETWHSNWDGDSLYVIELNNIELPSGFDPTLMILQFELISEANVELKNSSDVTLYSNNSYTSGLKVPISVNGDLQKIIVSSPVNFTINSIRFDSPAPPPTWYPQFSGWIHDGMNYGTWTGSVWEAELVSSTYTIRLVNYEINSPDYETLYFRCGIANSSAPVTLTVIKNGIPIYTDSNYTNNELVNLSSNPFSSGFTLLLESSETFDLASSDFFPEIYSVPE